MCGVRNSPEATRDEAPAATVRRPAEAPDRPLAVADPSHRASDAERDAAAAELQVHAAAGRLDVDELDARMSAVLTARTRADIADALGDLPAAATVATRPGDSGAHGANAYFAVMFMLVAIWLLTGAGHPWPLYPAIGWGLPLLMSRRSAAMTPTRLMPACQSGPR